MLFSQLYRKIRLLKYKKKEPYLSIYRITGFFPNDIQIYQQAFLHKSSFVEDDCGKCVNNERLEFLGDAILDAIIADIVYKHFPSKREGYLTNTRSKIVNRDTLNHIAQELGIDKLVKYTAKVTTHNSYICGNALEALIGAVYLDQGYERCFDFIQRVFMQRFINIDFIARKEMNFKSHLIEWGQKNRLKISFDVLESFNDNEGSPVFQTAVVLEGNIQMGVGVGYSKKESQQNASQMAVKKLRTDKAFLAMVNDLKKNKKRENSSKEPTEKDQTESETSETPAKDV